MPHGHCYLWQPDTLWLNVGSDGLIAASYLAIPVVIYTFIRKRHAQVAYAGVALMFAAFILLCGATHLMEIWTVWHPIYRAAGALKLTTALVSFATLLTLIWIMPQALSLKTPRQLQDEVEARTRELNEVNAQLRSQIEARDAAERELRTNNLRLARSNRDLEQFAYVASHDLRAPLSGIDNAAKWLEDDLHDTLSAESRRILGLIRRRISRMETLLSDILAYSRAGATDGDVEETTLADILASIVETLSPPPQFSVRLDGHLPTFYTSKAQLEQVLRNLISNAIKHHHQPRGEVVVSAAKVGDRLEFSVRDDGPGIAPEFHAKIFQMFQTLRRRDEVEGSGVGLAIVKKLVEQHNGRISIFSGGDTKGSEFRFSWPTFISPNCPEGILDA